MQKRYYFDTCIWRDHYEDRFSFSGKPLGDYATKLFMRVMKRKDILLYSDLTVEELKSDFDEQEINRMLSLLFMIGTLQKVRMSKKEYKEAKETSRKRNLPTKDVLHAILARNNNSILVSQDKHHQLMRDIVDVRKPQEII